MSLTYSGKPRRRRTAKQIKYFGPEPGKKFGRNPGGRKLTKKQRRAKAARTAKKRSKALAISTFMKRMNPAKAKKGYAYKVKKFRDGGFSVRPVKLGKVKK